MNPMMFPPFRFPYYNNYQSFNGYYRPQSNIHKNVIVNNEGVNYNTENSKKTEQSNFSTESDDFSTSSENQNRSSNSTSPVFEIFGIKLYFDDILIVCLIFFLYQENVHDQFLLIALIMLLLS